ncbi:eCIS core domain-containing protein [Pseudorhodoferax sp.]|uniref:eCIS core domain-containing protein n=1 Tax=Pseudorhodoferax sp. TaxID=1993553 RepID=UPI002DD6A28B|nr:DUF4157 domain-containing protein [Pseudorhodoferax sp.]
MHTHAHTPKAVRPATPLKSTIALAAPAIVHEVLRAPGRPLDPDTRGFMEPRFGQDFGRVRVHTDARAAASARTVNAKAYTVGHDLVFGAHQYAPDTRRGRELLAHELAHTVQQRGAGGAPPSADPHGIHESSAQAAASAVASGGAAPPGLPSCAVGLARAPDAFDRNELARQLEELNERLKRPDYAGRDRDLAAREALLAISGPDEDAEDQPAAKPAPSGNRKEAASVFLPGRFTDDEAKRLLRESEDEGFKKYREQEEQKEQQRQISQQVADETRHERFMGLRKLLKDHGFRRSDLAEYLTKRHSMRDLQILKQHGLQWPKRGPTQSNLVQAIEGYDHAWRKARGLAGTSMREWTEADQRAWERQQKEARILKAQLEGYGATTGSFLGAVSGGVARQFTDDEETIAAFAKGGATLEGMVTPFAQAKGQRGSLVPQVENAPAQPYGAWRYAGVAPTRPGSSPAVDPWAGTVPRQLDLSANLQVPVTLPKTSPAPAAPRDGPMRAPPGGGPRAGMTATRDTLTPHRKSTPVKEVLPRSTVPMSSFEPPEPGHYIRRKQPDASIQPQILANAGRTTDGRLRDANTGRALNPGEAVWAHAPDFQFAPMRNLFEKQGKTQAEFDAFYRDPAKWQIEYGPTNSSRVFDKIERQRPVH